MAKKATITFFCKHCGHETMRWEGRCPACQEWDAMVEAPREPEAPKSRREARRQEAAERQNAAGSPPKPLREHAVERLPRLDVPIGEFHRVLGGGIVPGGSVLVGGEPGVGKSTLLLQLLASLASADAAPEGPGWLYITGEEAPSQVAARGLRLGGLEEESTRRRGRREARDGAGMHSERLKLASETDLTAILAMLESEKPQVAVVDSIQTVRDPGLPSAPGSLAQVRECAMALVESARRLQTAIFLVGHINKEGSIAGPKVLEHVVDTVLSFEGETRLDLRCLRSLKNRFGSTAEVGFFEMTGTGLAEVPDPSALLIDREAGAEKGGGWAVGALCEGSRVLLVELQGLTVPAPGGGSPRRRASGVDANRLAQLLAVLETKAGVPFAMLDVFASAAGGFRVDEPAADLPLALALASVATGRQVREGLVAAGEIGLGGEIRPVPRLEQRIDEARRMGFQAILLPARSRTALPETSGGVRILRARTVREALAMALV